MRKNIRKFVTVLTMGCMMFSMGFTSKAASFPDVGSGSWFYDSVNWVSDAGIMKGYDNGKFGPSDKVTRGQFVTIMYRTDGSPETDFEWGLYEDVKDGTFYSIPTTWSYYSKVMTGYENGFFGHSDHINREQVATILYRYAVSKGYQIAEGNISEYPDGGRVSNFAKDGVGFALGAGLIRGDQGNINPLGNATRAEVATILERFYTYMEQQKEPVWHEPVYEQRWIVDKEAWDETISEPIYETLERSICNQCGEDITGNTTTHMKANFDCGGYHSEWKSVQTGNNTYTKHHEEVGHYEQVLVQEGYWG